MCVTWAMCPNRSCRPDRRSGRFRLSSLYEGFGFPVAQAMACGVPVITSNNSCLPEIAGPGALFVDPRSPMEIAAAIEPAVDIARRRGAARRGRSSECPAIPVGELRAAEPGVFPERLRIAGGYGFSLR